MIRLNRQLQTNSRLPRSPETATFNNWPSRQSRQPRIHRRRDREDQLAHTRPSTLSTPSAFSIASTPTTEGAK